MIPELAKALGITTEEFISAVHAATADPRILALDLHVEGRQIENWEANMMEWMPTGFAVMLVAGPHRDFSRLTYTVPKEPA